MKNNSGLLLFTALFVLLIATANLLGNYDPIVSSVPKAQAAMVIGAQATDWVEYGLRWIIGLALGATFTGFGVAAFGEARKAYRLWKRSAQAGRWQSGPNAQWQKQPQNPKLSRQDMILLALSGRLPQSERPITRLAGDEHDDDELGIQL